MDSNPFVLSLVKNDCLLPTQTFFNKHLHKHWVDKQSSNNVITNILQTLSSTKAWNGFIDSAIISVSTASSILPSSGSNLGPTLGPTSSTVSSLELSTIKDSFEARNQATKDLFDETIRPILIKWSAKASTSTSSQCLTFNELIYFNCWLIGCPLMIELLRYLNSNRNSELIRRALTCLLASLNDSKQDIRVQSLSVTALSHLVALHPLEESILSELNTQQLIRLTLSRAIYPTKPSIKSEPTIIRLSMEYDAGFARIGLLRLLQINRVQASKLANQEIVSFLDKWWNRLNEAATGSSVYLFPDQAIPSHEGECESASDCGTANGNAVPSTRLALECFCDVLETSSIAQNWLEDKLMTVDKPIIAFLASYLKSIDPRTAIAGIRLSTLVFQSLIRMRRSGYIYIVCELVTDILSLLGKHLSSAGNARSISSDSALSDITNKKRSAPSILKSKPFAMSIESDSFSQGKTLSNVSMEDNSAIFHSVTIPLLGGLLEASSIGLLYINSQSSKASKQVNALVSKINFDHIIDGLTVIIDNNKGREVTPFTQQAILQAIRCLVSLNAVQTNNCKRSTRRISRSTSLAPFEEYSIASTDLSKLLQAVLRSDVERERVWRAAIDYLVNPNSDSWFRTINSWLPTDNRLRETIIETSLSLDNTVKDLMGTAITQRCVGLSNMEVDCEVTSTEECIDAHGALSRTLVNDICTNSPFKPSGLSRTMSSSSKSPTIRKLGSPPAISNSIPISRKLSSPASPAESSPPIRRLRQTRTPMTKEKSSHHPILSNRTSLFCEVEDDGLHKDAPENVNVADVCGVSTADFEAESPIIENNLELGNSTANRQDQAISEEQFSQAESTMLSPIVGENSMENICGFEPQDRFCLFTSNDIPNDANQIANPSEETSNSIVGEDCEAAIPLPIAPLSSISGSDNLDQKAQLIDYQHQQMKQEEQIRSLQAALSLAVAGRSSYQKQCEHLQIENADLNARLEVVVAENSNYLSRLRSAETELVESKELVKDTESKLALQESALQDAWKQLSTLAESESRNRLLLASTQLSLQNRQSESDKFQAESNSLRLMNIGLQSRVVEMTKLMESKANQVQECSAQLAELESKCLSLTHEHAATKAKCTMGEEYIAASQEREKALRSSIEKMSEQIEKHGLTIRSQEMKIKELDATINDLSDAREAEFVAKLEAERNSERLQADLKQAVVHQHSLEETIRQAELRLELETSKHQQQVAELNEQLEKTQQLITMINKLSAKM